MKILTVPESGSLAGQTASRNRYGQYLRTRATPVNPSSSFQVTVRARLATNASNWRDLTAAQRLAWADLGSQITRNDSLGQSYTLTGFGAYCLVNNNKLAAGDTAISDPIAYAVPDPLLTITPTATVATLSVAYTTTPLAAGVRLFVYASPGRSPGRIFEGDYRLVSVTAAAAASPANIFAAYVLRFGAPVVGNKIFVTGQTYLAGIMGPPLSTSLIVA